jgi:hypothetical protein
MCVDGIRWKKWQGYEVCKPIFFVGDLERGDIIHFRRVCTK